MKENYETAELFNEHFFSTGEKLAKEIDPVDISSTQQVKQAESKFKFRKISSIEVFDMFKKWKINWIFHMPNKALKIAKDLREISLANIFNDSDPSILWY